MGVFEDYWAGRLPPDAEPSEQFDIESIMAAIEDRRRATAPAASATARTAPSLSASGYSSSLLDEARALGGLSPMDPRGPELLQTPGTAGPPKPWVIPERLPQAVPPPAPPPFTAPAPPDQTVGPSPLDVAGLGASPPRYEATPPPASPRAVVLRDPVTGKITLTNMADSPRYAGQQEVSGHDALLPPDRGGPLPEGMSGPPAPAIRRMYDPFAEGAIGEAGGVHEAEIPKAGGAYAGKPIMDIETMPPGQRPPSYWEDKAKELAIAEFAARQAALERDKTDPVWRERRKAEMEAAMAGAKKGAEESARYGPVDALIKQRGQIASKLEETRKEIAAANVPAEKKAAVLALAEKRAADEMAQLDDMIKARIPKYDPFG